MYDAVGGDPPWEVRADSSREVLVALYLRDALGVVDPSGLPRMLGTGLPKIDPPDDRITYWWMRWWISIVEPDAHEWGTPLQQLDDDALIVLPREGAEDYVAAVRRHLDAARSWATVAHEQHNGGEIARMPNPHEMVVIELVREHVAALGRAARPFRLRIEVLPLAESGIWWIADDAIAVDSTTRDEPILYRDALEPIVAAIV